MASPKCRAGLRGTRTMQGQEPPFIFLLILDTLGSLEGKGCMLNRLLASLVKTGTLTVTAPDGRSARFGQGDPQLGLRFRDRMAMLELGVNPEL
jgi:hypothetical protein